MSFVFNSAAEQQLSLWDSYASLTPREKRVLGKSLERSLLKRSFQRLMKLLTLSSTVMWRLVQTHRLMLSSVLLSLRSLPGKVLMTSMPR